MRIGLLGTLAVYDEAGELVHVGGYRVRMLLILLALDVGRVVPAYSLIERLWEDDPPANSGNSLQSLVSRLRTSLRRARLGDQVIESHPAGYRLAISPHEVDIVAFEALAREGSQALASGDPIRASRLLREALGAWRGPALADASGARFAAGPSARLEELRVRVAQDLIEAGLALGEGDSLIAELRDMVAADPVAERPRGLLMRALYAAGRQAEALAVYSETRELLASELGVDPSPQTEQIYLGILRQDLHDEPRGRLQPGKRSPAAPGEYPEAERAAAVDSDSPRLNRVRKPLTSFVGRDVEIVRVQKMLAESRLVTLTGPGGAGKTRLAIETAARLAEESPDWTARLAAAQGQAQARGDCQVRLVDLAPVTEPGEVPYAVLRAFGIRESPVIANAGAGQLSGFADPAQRLVAALWERRDLLILDNCEHVVAAAAALADQVLASCPDVRMLVTSREPLRIAGEALWPVSSLPVPPLSLMAGREAQSWTVDTDGAVPQQPDDTRSQVASYASVRLLADRAAAVRPDFTVDEANAADVGRICRALDGMPLAIELAAARLRTLSPAQLAERLDARFELLTGGSRTAVPRHQTLRAVVEWSWALLSEHEQILAMRLATFSGGATLTAVEQVCSDGALPADTILPAIFGLVEKSFLTVDGNGESRYRMLETIRAYCLERLAESGQEVQVRYAFAAHFLALAETADPQLRGAQQRTWIRQLTAEQDNIHAALRWVIDRRDAPLALRFGHALGWFWLLRGQRRESGTVAREILAISEPSAHVGAADRDLNVLQARAVCAFTSANASWDIGEARQPLTDVLSLLAPEAEASCDGHGGPPSHPLVIAGVAMLVLYDKRDPEQALRLVAAQFDSADAWTRSGARLLHTFFSMNLGRMNDVARECAEALAGFRAIGDRWGMALALLGQAELAALDGDHNQVIAALEEAVELSGELTDWEDTAQMYASLAKSRSRVGDYRGARADMAKAERAARELGESEADCWISYIQAELAWLRGDLAEASTICRLLDARMSSKNSAITWSFQALAKNRGALADLRSGNIADGCTELAVAFGLARDSQERSALAAVVDGLAAATVWTDGSRAGAERAVVMLGAAHSIRGAFDRSSLDAPEARDTARQTLGGTAFDAAYQRGRELGYEEALAVAESAIRLISGG